MNQTYQSSTYKYAQDAQLLRPSNLKIFHGEDLTSGDRKRLQQLQQQDWLNQQIRQKQQAEQARQALKQAHDLNTKTITDMRTSLEDQKAQRLRNVQISTKTTNKHQLDQKINRERNQREEDTLDKLAHIEYVTNNNFYTENTETCQSMLGRNRVIPYHWKGMNQDQRRQILLEQQKQRKEKQLQAEIEKQQQKLFALQQQQLRKYQVKLDREKNKGIQNVRKGQDEYNLLKAEQMRRKVFHAYGDIQTFKNE